MKVIAVLYNDEEEVNKFLSTYVVDVFMYQWRYGELTVHYKNSPTLTLIPCKGDFDSVVSRFAGVELSYYVVADGTAYCGKALQYLNSRIRL